MFAEFSRPDVPGRVVGRAHWSGGGVEVVADDEDVRAALDRIYRPTPIAADDPALRAAGASGPVVLAPGELSWFIQASRLRSKAEGLAARIVAESSNAMAWDPAASYRTFSQVLERRASMVRPADA